MVPRRITWHVSVETCSVIPMRQAQRFATGLALAMVATLGGGACVYALRTPSAMQPDIPRSATGLTTGAEIPTASGEEHGWPCLFGPHSDSISEETSIART